ncbi:MAG: proton-conducting transporter membrane subunit, partial [Candidatus Omnitrophica bacterium]|nr:proton-conducting transporter membrane subunit [Candidatus Omnitrophota bacterium]
ALLNCAFLGILRAHQVMLSAGLGAFSGDLLMVLGFASMFIAAVFILGQTDYKRMLAYSSVEHMGIMAIGVGLGGGALFGVMLHAVGHSFTKAALFLTAGNILSDYKTKSVAGVKGVMSRLPVTGALWMAGFLAITGLPPFSIFLSKFVILKEAVDKGRMLEAGGFLALLAVIFIGMTAGFLRMLQPGSEQPQKKVREPLSLVLPACVLCLLVAVIGIYQPEIFRRGIEQAAAAFKGI